MSVASYLKTAGEGAVQPVSPATPLPVLQFGGDGHYETVAASQSDQALGPTGAAGDVLSRLIIVPATTAAGNVSIKDGAGSAISVFVTGTLADLTPIVLDLGMVSLAGAWKITTGANVSVIAIGRFT